MIPSPVWRKLKRLPTFHRQASGDCHFQKCWRWWHESKCMSVEFNTLYPLSINPKPNFSVFSQTSDDQTPMITVPLSSLTPDKGNSVRNDTNQPVDRPPALPQLLPTKAPPANATASPLFKLPSNGDSHEGQTTKAPTNAPEKPHNPAGNFHLKTSLFILMLMKWSPHFRKVESC